MPTLVQSLGIVIAILCSCLFSPAVAGAYDVVMTKETTRLDRWDIPLVRLVITNARPYPNDEHLAYIEANVIEIIREGVPPLHLGPTAGQWRKVEILSSSDPVAPTQNEPFDDDLFRTLMNSSLICFVGSMQSQIILDASRCYLDTPENYSTAVESATKRPLSSQLYQFSSNLLSFLPLIGLIVVFFSPAVGAVIAALSFPAGVYILSHAKPYDPLWVYPMLIFAGLVTAVGFTRWLHQMVKHEQKEKPDSRKQEISNSD